jgi:hypothetical protein
MSTFRKMAKRMGVDTGDFNVWMDRVLNPKSHDPRKRLFEAYDRSLHQNEVAQAYLEAFVMKWMGRLGFKARLAKRGERVKVLERESVKRLTAILDAYLADVKGR